MAVEIDVSVEPPEGVGGLVSRVIDIALGFPPGTEPLLHWTVVVRADGRVARRLPVKAEARAAEVAGELRRYAERHPFESWQAAFRFDWPSVVYL